MYASRLFQGRGMDGVTTPLTSPRRGIGERRTYGLYRNYTLLGVFVADLHQDCVSDRLRGSGLEVFMLHEHDISLRPDCEQVMAGLQDRYQEVSK